MYYLAINPEAAKMFQSITALFDIQSVFAFVPVYMTDATTR